MTELVTLAPPHPKFLPLFHFLSPENAFSRSFLGPLWHNEDIWHSLYIKPRPPRCPTSLDSNLHLFWRLRDILLFDLAPCVHLDQGGAIVTWHKTERLTNLYTHHLLISDIVKVQESMTE